MVLVLVSYQARFFFPYQICVQEYVTYKRIAADLFLIPNKIVSGGVVGIATLIHYTLGTPVGVVEV